MAKFQIELPTEIMRDIKRIHDNADEIFGEMTKAGAEAVEKNIQASLPDGIRKSNMMKCLRTTRTYKTPSDDGINTKVGFFGYFEDENGRVKPAPLVANIFEYGRSGSPFPKHPFLRKSFKKGEIEAVMLKVQKEKSGGLLDE